MKKFLFGFFALLCASYAFAGAWTAPTSFPTNTGSLLMKQIYNTSTADRAIYGTDSILGADTINIVTKMTVDPTATYMLSTSDSVGATDTIRIEVVTYRGDGTQLGVAECDTIVPVAGAGTFYRQSAIQVNKTVAGSTMTIRAIGWISAKIAKIRKATVFAIVPIQPYEPNKLKQVTPQNQAPNL